MRRREPSHFSLASLQRTLHLEGFLILADDKRALHIRAYFRILSGAWGPQHWWPAQSPFEVIVGAFLTQNTSWKNVEKALANLRAARLLSVGGIRLTPLKKLEGLIRSAGYFRQKAKRLKLFVAFLDDRYKGSPVRMFAQPTEKLRDELLSLHGIGPETADSILLYAGNHPVFVVDAYTRRVLGRHEILAEKSDYEEIRKLFEGALAPVGQLVQESEEDADQRRFPARFTVPAGTAHPPSVMSTGKRTALVQVYNEMHGLIVGVGKNYCRKSQARCDECPLQEFLPRNRHGVAGLRA